MQLSVLGPVLVDGRAPRGAKERALLARLLVSPGSPVPAETLIEAAWPAKRRDGVTRSLHVRLAKLRALLDPGRTPGSGGRVLVREPAGHRLAVSPESVDAQRFAALADEAARRPPSEALEVCDEALALWRGEPFADLELVDDAATVEARRLHAIRDRLRRARAGALAALGRADEAAAELAALVAEEPLSEELVAELMAARYAAGRHVEALDAYRQLAVRLAPRGGARRRSQRRPAASDRTRRRGADRRAARPGQHRALARAGGARDVALAADDLDTARAEYGTALALALDVRAQVGPSLPVDARVALAHLRLAQVADEAATAHEHLTRALQYARASRAPAVIAAAEAAAAPAHAGP